MDQNLDGVKTINNKDEEEIKPIIKIKKRPVAKKTDDAASAKKPENKSKRGRFSLFVTTTIAVLVVGGAIYVWQQKVGEKSTEKIKEEAKSARLDFEQRLNNLKDTITGIEKENTELKGASEQLKTTEELLAKAKIENKNDELGITFSYPAIFGQADVVIAGASGKGMSVNGSFSKSEKIIFGGVSKDFAAASSTATSSISFLETTGFVEKDKKFYWQPAGGKESLAYEVKPLKVIEAKNTKALLVDKKSFITVPEGITIDIGENIGAIVNLKNKTFTGLAFIDKDLGIMPMAEFEAMLKTIEVK